MNEQEKKDAAIKYSKNLDHNAHFDFIQGLNYRDAEVSALRERVKELEAVLNDARLSVCSYRDELAMKSLYNEAKVETDLIDRIDSTLTK